MAADLTLICWSLAAYLVGSVPMGLLVGWLRGVDLREHGSGNIGATNASRTLGRKLGHVVFALDFVKSILPLALAWWTCLSLRPDALVAACVVGFAAVLGHVFPIWLRFRGGKGVASGFAVLLFVVPAAALVGLLLYVQTLVLTRLTSAASLTGVSAATLFVLASDQPTCVRVLALAVAGLVLARHRANIRELLDAARERKQRSPTPRT
jgi:glycerol-3-phosphate acyltransferase PlsY